MALAQASDDSLSQIITFLTAQDVVRLMATGSRGFMLRVARNTASLFWRFSRPAYFPSCSYSLANLRSLTIKSSDENGHLSLHGRALLPLEPMASLESLVLDFPTSHLVFAPPTSYGGMTLSSSFPKLTSLAVHSQNRCTIPDEWAESLPERLLSLTVDIHLSRDSSVVIDPTSFDALSQGLQHLEFGASCTVGYMRLERFPDLRVLRIDDALSWDVLEILPNSLEELGVRCWSYEAPGVTFALSKLPPKIRSLALVGAQLTLNFDAMAPSTLEELELSLENDITAQDLDFFQTKNFRVVRDLGYHQGDLTPESLLLLPNVIEIHRLGGVDTALDTLEILPRKLESLTLQDRMRTASSVSYQYLPPSLKQFTGPIMCINDISELPKSITSLSIHRPASSSLTIPAAVWRELPSILRRLDVQTCLFETEECFQVLPDGIEDLLLDLHPSDETGQRITFSKSLQASLKSLHIYFQGPSLSHTGNALDPSFFPKLSELSRLSSIRIGTRISINSSTLAFLPKSLRFLELDIVHFENDAETCTDWKEGAFSRLPEGLELLSVTNSKSSTVSIDFKLFSHLPPRLATLNISSRQEICEDPKSFISSLPRRIWNLRYYYSRQKIAFGADNCPRDREKELRQAIDEYFSDPFWDGQRYATYGSNLFSGL